MITAHLVLRGGWLNGFGILRESLWLVTCIDFLTLATGKFGCSAIHAAVGIRANPGFNSADRLEMSERTLVTFWGKR